MNDGSILKIEQEGKEIIGIIPLRNFKGPFKNPIHHLEILDFGFPISYEYVDPSVSYVSHGENRRSKIEKITQLNKSQFIEHLKKKSDDLYSLTESKDLVAACFASRYHFLNGIIENIKNDNNEGIYLHNIIPGYPKTGVYVLSARDQKYPEEKSGWRNNQDPSKINLEGIAFNPRVPPRIASQIVSRWYGNKFGSVEGVKINFSINFNSFFCHEVPDFAIDFVKNPTIFSSPAKRKDYLAMYLYGKK